MADQEWLRIGALLVAALVTGCASVGEGSVPAGVDGGRPAELTPLGSPAPGPEPTAGLGRGEPATTSNATDPSAPHGPATVPPTLPPTVAATTTVETSCGASSRLPGEALGFSELQTDLTGDGAPDLLVSYGLPTGDGLMRWRLRLEPSSGPPSDLELDDAAGPTVKLLGAVQLDPVLTDGAGRADEVFVALGGEPEAVNVGIVGADDTGCLFRFGDGLGLPAHFAIGSTERRRDGLRCELSGEGTVLVQLTATSPDGGTFATQDIRLQRVTTNLVPESIAEGSATLDGPSLFAYSLLDCPGVTAL